MLPVLMVSLFACWLPLDETTCVATKPAGSVNQAQVTVVIVDPLNLRTLDARITLRNDDRAFFLESGQPRTVPLGVYNLSVSGARDRTLVVDRSEVSVRIPVSFGISLGCQPTDHYVAGVVTGGGESRELWAKLVQLAGTASHEVKLSPRGYFLFDHLANGKYVLLLLEGTRLVHTAVVDVPFGADRPVNVKISL